MTPLFPVILPETVIGPAKVCGPVPLTSKVSPTTAPPPMFRVLVAKLNVKSESVLAVVIVPDVLSVKTTLSLPLVPVLNSAPVLSKPAPSPKNALA